MRAHDWEEVVNELTDDKNRLWDALNNITALWAIEAPMSEIENALHRAKGVLKDTDIEHP